MAWNMHHSPLHDTGRYPKGTTMNHHTTLGDLIEVFYAELVTEYGDENLAEVVAATLVNEMILAGHHVDQEIAAA